MSNMLKAFLKAGVNSANMVKTNGKVHHYIVRIKTKHDDVFDRLVEMWNFSNSSISDHDNNYVVEYRVNPDEAEEFYQKLSEIPNLVNENRVAIIIMLNYPLTERTKQKVTNSLRSEDMVKWNDDHITILLNENKQEAIHAVRNRVQKLLDTNIKDVSVKVG